MELLGTRQPKPSRAAVSIDGEFDVRQQTRRVLDFVDQDLTWKPLQEKSGVAARQLNQPGIIQADISAILTGQGLEEGGFADLPGSGEEDNGEMTRGGLEMVLEGSSEVHSSSFG
jgi:hypothetical protein